MIFTLISGLFTSVHAVSPVAVMDSTGLVREGGVSFVTHRVEIGETLYSLSRKYSVGVQEIIDANPGSQNGLKAGSTLRIPYSVKSDSSAGAVHTVRAGETLFSLSRQYNVGIEALKSANNLTGNSLRVGQKLRIPQSGTESMAGASSFHVVKASETLYSISKLYNTSPAQLRKWNDLEGNQLKIGQKLLIADSGAPNNGETSASSMLPQSAVEPRDVEQKEETAAPSTPAKSDSPPPDPVTERLPEKDYARTEKIVQRGLAEVIKDSDETRKYLAMHRSAPVGTIMQIKNEMNDQVVFVRVVGTVQSTGDNDKVLVMISQKAYDRLGAVDQRFPVEISYIP